MTTYTLDQLVEFAKGAGFTGDQAKTMGAIAMAESGGNPWAYNPNDPGGSYGLTQVNAGAHGPSALATMGNPAEAFKQAFRISGGGTNFRPWSVFTNGMYLPFAAKLGLTGGQSTGPNSTIVTGASTAVSGDPTAGLIGQTATGATQQAGSPLSAIFGAVANLFQNAGVLVLGVVLVAIGAYYAAKPGSSA